MMIKTPAEEYAFATGRADTEANRCGDKSNVGFVELRCQLRAGHDGKHSCVVHSGATLITVEWT